MIYNWVDIVGSASHRSLTDHREIPLNPTSLRNFIRNVTNHGESVFLCLIRGRPLMIVGGAEKKSEMNLFFPREGLVELFFPFSSERPF